MRAKRGDFVLIDYTGRTADGAVFDTTDLAVARAAGIYDERGRYRPALVIVGGERAIAGLEAAIEGMAEGEEKEAIVPPEQGFGPRRDDLIVVTSAARFRAEGLKPEVGAVFNIDGKDGVVRSVSGGRVVIDFNHPLAGKELHYKIRLIKIIEGLEQKLAAMRDDVGLKGTITAKEGTARAELTADVSMDYVVKKQALLKWIAEFLPEIKRVEVIENYNTEIVRRELRE